jgi:hypothetical protein
LTNLDSLLKFNSINIKLVLWKYEMNKTPELLDFVKAASDANRLRIIGVLAQRPATIKEIAQELDLPYRLAFNHLAYLERVGVVYRKGDVFNLDDSAVESLSRTQFAGKRETYSPAPDLDPKSRKVLVAHLNADGTIRQIPFQSSKLHVVLNYLISAFALGVDYSEKEVNTILRRFHEDTAGLRRDLVDAGLLARESDGSRYWRHPEQVEGRPS